MSLAANLMLALAGEDSWLDVAVDLFAVVTFGYGAKASMAGRQAKNLRYAADPVDVELAWVLLLVLSRTHPVGEIPVLPEEGPRWPLSRTEDGGYTITDPERGQPLHFAAAGASGRTALPLRAVTDRIGHRIERITLRPQNAYPPSPAPGTTPGTPMTA